MSSAVTVEEASIRERRRDIFLSAENNMLELRRKPLRVGPQEQVRKDLHPDHNHNLVLLLLEAVVRADQVLAALPQRTTVVQGPPAMEDLPRQDYQQEMVEDQWLTVPESDKGVHTCLLQSNVLIRLPEQLIRTTLLQKLLAPVTVNTVPPPLEAEKASPLQTEELRQQRNRQSQRYRLLDEERVRLEVDNEMNKK